MNIISLSIILGIVIVCILGYQAYHSYSIYIANHKKIYQQQLQIDEQQKLINKQNQQLQDLGIEIYAKEEQLCKVVGECGVAQQQVDNAIHYLNEIEKSAIQRKENCDLQVSIFVDHCNTAKEAYADALEADYIQVENHFCQLKEKLQNEKSIAEAEIQKLKDALSAAAKAKLREQEKEQQLEFYKIQINQNDLEDVQELNRLKSKLHQPEILSKLIWTTYYQKKVTDMCNRILNNPTAAVCGIYKITNLITQQYYIGQSVDIATRWKTHCKCGLGIDASATNKLYNSMQESGLHNFTFEVMEECKRDELNEKERFWIEAYSADSVGLNSKKGNK